MSADPPTRSRAHLIERAMGLAPRLRTPPPAAAAPVLDAAPPVAPEVPGYVPAYVPHEAPADVAPAALDHVPAYDADPAFEVAEAATAFVAPDPVAVPASPAAAPRRISMAAAPLSLDQLRRAGMVVLHATGQRHRMAEELAVIQHQVLRTLRTVAGSTVAEGRCVRTVMVTSARPNEGKSFTALNIAAAIASGSTTPVLLVDIDGKRGSVTDLLDCRDLPGLRTLAADPARYPPYPVPTVLERLTFLPYGISPPGAPQVPSGESLIAAIQALATLLPRHLIVLDAPPCLSTSEPSVLAPIAGQVVMVVRAEHTQRNEVEAALDMIDACPTLQLLLNQARLVANDSFGAYGYGAYGAYGSDQPGG